MWNSLTAKWRRWGLNFPQELPRYIPWVYSMWCCELSVGSQSVKVSRSKHWLLRTNTDKAVVVIWPNRGQLFVERWANHVGILTLFLFSKKWEGSQMNRSVVLWSYECKYAWLCWLSPFVLNFWTTYCVSCRRVGRAPPAIRTLFKFFRAAIISLFKAFINI